MDINLGLDLAPTPVDHLVESVDTVVSGVPTAGNAALCVDSLCTSGRASINFCRSNNPLAKAFFLSSIVLGSVGASASGVALATEFTGIPASAWIGALGARGCNRLGKYTLKLGKLSNGDITNPTDIGDIVE